MYCIHSYIDIDIDRWKDLASIMNIQYGVVDWTIPGMGLGLFRLRSGRVTTTPQDSAVKKPKIVSSLPIIRVRIRVCMYNYNQYRDAKISQQG